MKIDRFGEFQPRINPWDQPQLSGQRQALVIPLLEPSLNGEIDIDWNLEQDMIIDGAPGESPRMTEPYSRVGVDQSPYHMQFGANAHERTLRHAELLGERGSPELNSISHHSPPLSSAR